MRRTALLTAFPLLLLSLLAGCRPAPEATPPSSGPQAGGTAVFAASSDIDTFNELLGTGTNFSGDILQKLFLPLLREQPDYQEHPPTFAPALATSYEHSEDRLSIIFHLRSDAVWSDGEPITAEDVRWTWQAQVDPEVAWSYSQVKEAITDVEVLDSHSVRFHFSRAYAHQLLDANEGVILPRHAWSQLPFAQWREQADWFREHLVTSGPFRLERWAPQEEIVLARSESYFEEGRPRIDRAVFRILPDAKAQVTQLLSGRLDLVSGLSPEDALRVEEAAGTEVLAFQHRAYTFLCWNTARPLFADREIRRALTMALDRSALIEAIYRGYASPSVSPIISSVWAHDDELLPWPYDPDEARRLLAEGGWQDHDDDGVLDRDGVPFSFELSTNSGNSQRADTLVLVQEQLARVGVEARPRFLEINTLIQQNLGHEFDATLGTWGIDTTLDLSYAFHSESIDGGYNYGSYHNPEVDRLIEEARAARVPEDAGPALRELQQRLHHDQPYTFLWEPMRLVGVSRRLQDARPNPLYTFFDLEHWWLDSSAD